MSHVTCEWRFRRGRVKDVRRNLGEWACVIYLHNLLIIAHDWRLAMGSRTMSDFIYLMLRRLIGKLMLRWHSTNSVLYCLMDFANAQCRESGTPGRSPQDQEWTSSHETLLYPFVKKETRGLIDRLPVAHHWWFLCKATSGKSPSLKTWDLLTTVVNIGAHLISFVA